MRDQTFMTLMKLMPKSPHSAAVGKATRAPLPKAWHRAFMRAFDQSRNISDHKTAVFGVSHDTQIRNKGCEGIIRNLRTGGRDCGDQR
jgi:phosphatidylserine decarboxylase